MMGGIWSAISVQNLYIAPTAEPFNPFEQRAARWGGLAFFSINRWPDLVFTWPGLFLTKMQTLATDIKKRFSADSFVA